MKNLDAGTNAHCDEAAKLVQKNRIHALHLCHENGAFLIELYAIHITRPRNRVIMKYEGYIILGILVKKKGERPSLVKINDCGNKLQLKIQTKSLKHLSKSSSISG